MLNGSDHVIYNYGRSLYLINSAHEPVSNFDLRNYVMANIYTTGPNFSTNTAHNL